MSVEWVPESDWSKVNVGDRVRVENDGDVAEFVVHKTDALANWLESRNDLTVFSGEGWSLFVVPKPTPALPTEPGIYMDAAGDLWELFRDGAFAPFCDGLPAIVAECAPFTRLESQADTARKIIAAILADADFSQLGPFWHSRVSNVGKKFGVTE